MYFKVVLYVHYTINITTNERNKCESGKEEFKNVLWSCPEIKQIEQIKISNKSLTTPLSEMSWNALSFKWRNDTNFFIVKLYWALNFASTCSFFDELD